MSDIVAFLTARYVEDEAWGDDSGDRGGEYTPESRARIFADVASKRAILTEHQPEPIGPVGCTFCSRVLYDMWPCPTLRHLAAPYADHSEYDTAWSVTA